MRSSTLPTLALSLGLAVALACAPDGSTQVALGPVDGRDLPPADTGRVSVGDVAPDFSLVSLNDGIVTLSAFRGTKDVVLVFYRGHW